VSLASVGIEVGLHSYGQFKLYRKVGRYMRPGPVSTVTIVELMLEWLKSCQKIGV
jgi:hypothetical protein